ncbi:hypothetical protein HY628_00085 [Candidatus Uhrbacteria bacterium]|nr:hypothetical protein [Candidatus Uhrbacteria bacterium]
MFEKPSSPKPPLPPPSSPPPEKGRFEIPAGAAPKAEARPVIHTIPSEYYGILPKTSVKKEVVTPPAPAKPRPPPKPAEPPAVQKKKGLSLFLLLGVVFLAVVAVGGYLFLRSLRPPSQAPRPEAPSSPPPPVAVCGNTVCEAGETATLCPSDCSSPLPAPPPPIRSGIDSDSDGLTDIEETTIYKSNPLNPDTDGDSFIDGNEVFHLYDPTRGAQARLEQHKEIERFVRENLPITLIIPKAWELAGGGESEFIFDLEFLTRGGELIGVWAERRSSDETLEEWFEANVKDLSVVPFETKQGIPGWRSTDQRIVFLAPEETDFVLGMHYRLDSVRTIEFLRTFEMMINSLQVVSSL